MHDCSREMDRGYWEGMANVYEDEIFSVLHNDHRGVIINKINEISSKDASVADIGCGIGHFLPVLAERFGHVYANDISSKLLKTAKDSHGHFSNISFLRGDVGFVFKKIPLVDCVVSVNAVISSSISVRQRMFKAMSSILKSGGNLLLVVPSLESALYVDIKFMHWKWKKGMSLPAALRSTFPPRHSGVDRVRQGIISIDGVATKHYLREELHLSLREAGMDFVGIDKITYRWETEFVDPPKWMAEPYPWDWLVVAKKQ